MNYKQIEKQIVKNKAVQGVMKVRDKINKIFRGKAGLKMDIKQHTVKKPKWTPTEIKFIKWTGR